MDVRSALRSRSGGLSWLGVAVFFFVAGALFTHPLLIHLSNTVPQDLGDPLLVTWILAWNFKQFEEGFDNYRTANILYPMENNFFLSETMVGIAALGFPIYLITKNVVAVYSLLFWLSFPLAGIGMAAVCFLRTRSLIASAIGGFIFAFAPYRFDHLAHLQLQWLVWLPVWILVAELFLSTGRARYAVLGLVVFVIQGLSAIYYFLFLFLIAGLVLGVSLLSRDRARRKRSGVLVGATVAGLLLLLPYLRMYQSLRARHAFTTPLSRVKLISATPLSYAAAPWCNRLYRKPTKPIYQHGANLLVGVAPAALAMLGLGWRRNPRTGVVTSNPAAAKVRPGIQKWVTRISLVWAIIALLAIASTYAFPDKGWIVHLGPLPISVHNPHKLTLQWDIAMAVFLFVTPWTRKRIVGWWKGSRDLDRSIALLGITAFLFSQFYIAQVVSWAFFPYRLIRNPGRWGMVVMICVAYYGAIGMSNVLSRIRKPSLRAITPCLVFAVIGAEYFSGPMRLREVPTEKTLHPAYKWLRAQDEISVIAEIPMDQVYDATWYQYHSTFHWKNLVNGYSGYLPKSYMKFARKMLDFPNTNSLSELQARQVDVVLVHGDRMRRSRFEEKRDHLRQVDAFPVPWEDKDTLIVQIPREKLPKAELSVRLTAGKYNYGFSGMKVLLENRETNLVCTTNALGWAYFPFLEPGRYVLRIDSGDGKSPGRELLVGTEDIREIIRLPLARPGTGALVLRVVDEKNKRPLQRVKITLTKERKTVKEDWDRNGLFIARYLEPGNYSVAATPHADTHVPIDMKLHLETRPLVLDLPIPRRR